MSYDLYFRNRSSTDLLSRGDFERYFKQRKFFTMNDAEAFYSNEDTGVYFSFEFRNLDNDVEADEFDPLMTPVWFNLNFVRPHPFGLEAEPEVSAFVAHFDLTVSDPQMSGMGDGEYSAQGFLDGWNAGNEFGYRAILSHHPDQDVLSLPTTQIETYWQWNHQREARQDEIGDDVFVPKIWFVQSNSRIQTAVAWADGISVWIPKVDLILVPRMQLAPRRWFRHGNDDVVIFEWNELEPLFAQFRRIDGPPISFELSYDSVPVQIEKTIRERSLPGSTPTGVPFDQVLNEELVFSARKGV